MMEDAIYSHKDCGTCQAGTIDFGRNFTCQECKGYGSTMTVVSESKPNVEYGVSVAKLQAGKQSISHSITDTKN